MKKFKTQFNAFVKLQNKANGVLKGLESKIQDITEFEIFIEHQQSDGFLLMTEDKRLVGKVAIGMPLTEAIKIIDKNGKLTLEDWHGIG